MTKNPGHIGMFSNWLRKPEWSCYSSSIQGSHEHLKTWKNTKKKSSMHGKIMEFEKKTEKSWNFVK